MGTEERITADELAYHERVLGQLRQAQAAWQSWALHLGQKYELGPQGLVDDRGAIHRASVAPGGEQGPPEEDGGAEESERPAGVVRPERAAGDKQGDGDD